MSLVEVTEQDREFVSVALGEARQSYDEGGIPVGAVLARDGAVIATGHNQLLQTNDPTSHGGTDCIRNAGILNDYDGATLYTTLTPCTMCIGTILFLGIPRLVIGERENYECDIDFLIGHGLDVAVLDDADCIAFLRKFIAERPDIWRW